MANTATIVTARTVIAVCERPSCSPSSVNEADAVSEYVVVGVSLGTLVGVWVNEAVCDSEADALGGAVGESLGSKVGVGTSVGLTVVDGVGGCPVVGTIGRQFSHSQ